MVEYDLLEVALPDRGKAAELRRDGYRLLDRVLDVDIRKNAIPDEPQRKRFECRIIEYADFADRIKDIAREVFVNDYRFHKTEELSDPDADTRISEYADSAGSSDGAEVVGLFLKDDLVGALILTKEDEKGSRIALAGVRNRYQGTGGAQELYLAAVEHAFDNGASKVVGRISSMNTAVINLYAYLGGKFTNPVDIYVKEK